MRPGVLSRYLIRLHAGPFLFALSTLTGLIFLNAIAQRMDGLMGKGLPWTVIAEFMVLSLPHTIALSLPMAVLVAVLYAFSELTASHEITAIAAGGISPSRILLPLVAMGAVYTGVMLYFNDAVLPESNHRLKNLMVDIGRKSPTFQLREQVVNEIRTEDGLNRYFLTADRIDPATNTLETVTIFDGNESLHQRTTYARTGVMQFNENRTDLYLTLYDGVVNEVQGDRYGGFQRLYFEKQIIPLRGVGDQLERQAGGTERSDREMGFSMLREKVVEKEGDLSQLQEESRTESLETVRMALGIGVKSDSTAAGDRLARLARGEVPRVGGAGPASLLGRDGLTQNIVVSSRTRASRATSMKQSMNRYRVEIHKKLAIAFACLIFTLMGPPLALRFPRGGVGMVIGASTLIFFVYYMGLNWGEDLADKGSADPIVSMWIPNAVFLATGLLLARAMGSSGSTVRGGAEWPGRITGAWERLAGLFRRSEPVSP